MLEFPEDDGTFMVVESGFMGPIIVWDWLQLTVRLQAHAAESRLVRGLSVFRVE